MDDDNGGMGVLELRTYSLVAGSGAQFHQLITHGSAPMLRRWGIDVVFHGPALQDPDRYLLVRSFASEDDRVSTLRSFYDSEEWRRDWDEAVMALIDGYHVIALAADAALTEALRAGLAPRE